MLYQTKIKVRYSEAERGGKAGLFQLLQYFQDLATFQSYDFGFGVYEECMKDRAWFLLAYDIKIDRYPRMFEEITIRTNPYKIQRAYGYRAFEVLDPEGNVIVEADSMWVFMNTEKLLPVKVPEELVHSFEKVNEEREDALKRKFKLPKEVEWDFADEFDITRFFLDTNSHVNNAYYALWTELILPPDAALSNIRIDYRKAALPGDHVTVYTGKCDGMDYIKFENQDGDILALQKMEFADQDAGN